MGFRIRVGAALIVIAAVLASGLAVGASRLRADQVGDKIDEARVKARAGKTAEAVDDLNTLAADSPADPRIHYYKAVFLLDLDRRNDAADALEQAETTLARYLKDGGKAPEVLGIQADLKKLADDALLYRRQARTVLADYKAKSIPIARELLKQGKVAQANFILEELAAVSPPDDADLDNLRKEIVAAGDDPKPAGSAQGKPGEAPKKD